MRETFIVSLFFWATLDLEHLISVVSLNCGLYLSSGASKFKSTLIRQKIGLVEISLFDFQLFFQLFC